MGCGGRREWRVARACRLRRETGVLRHAGVRAAEPSRAARGRVTRSPWSCRGRTSRPVGTWSSPRRRWSEVAADLGLAVQQPEKLGVDEFYQPFRELAPDVAVVVALRPADHAAGAAGADGSGFVNLHPSLLPRHRGPTPDRVGDPGGRRRDRRHHDAPRRGASTPGRSCCSAPPRSGRRTARRASSRGSPHLGAELLVETLPGLEAGTVTAQPPGSTPRPP